MKYPCCVIHRKYIQSDERADFEPERRGGAAHHAARRICREIYGEGILILGESGVGKSETAVELVKRGHRLIADDAVELRRVCLTARSWGTAPENIRHFIELRGVGIINVARVFGSGAVKMSEKSGSCGGAGAVGQDQELQPHRP